MILRMAMLTGQALLVCLMAGCGAKVKGHMVPVFAFIALNTPKNRNVIAEAKRANDDSLCSLATAGYAGA